MSKQSILEKLESQPASFHYMSEPAPRNMKPLRVYVPTPKEVAKAISAIPKGQTLTIEELRRAVGTLGKADTACPAKVLKYWKWMAEGAEQLQGTQYVNPWWRVLKDGKPSKHMPGGEDAQVKLLAAEGVHVGRPESKSALIEKLESAPPASKQVLDSDMAKRLKGKTMFVPSPKEIAKVVAKIPKGKTKSVDELREELAKMGNADIACPLKTLKYLKWLAVDVKELAETPYAVPWWRVLKDGQPFRLAGGIKTQVELLQAEDIRFE